jgi:DNA-binding transcriptional LysR family regulator
MPITDRYTVKLSQIRDFVAVMENGSVAGAARSLGVSQPSVSKSIRSLERDLDLPLLQRTSRGVVATDYGRAFFRRAKAAQSELSKARQELGQIAGRKSGFVAFGCGPILAELLLPDAVAQFRTRFPMAGIRIFEGFADSLIPLVRDSTLELAFTARLPRGLRRESGVAFRPLFFHDRVVMCRKGHPLAKARSLRELLDADWLTLEPPTLLHREFAARNLEIPRSVIVCESYAGFVPMLESADMVGIAPRTLLSRPLARGLLQAMELDAPLSTLSVGIFSRADTRLTPAAAAMAEAVTAVSRKFALNKRVFTDR